MGKIPVIHINSEAEEKDYLKNHKTNIHIKIMDTVEFAYDNDVDSIEIVKVVNAYRGVTFVLCVTKENWEDSLNKSLTHFIEQEEYELCDKVHKIIKKITDE
jgi:5-formaminoimidazole-4-carboxamide-1-beta-D-ribofuranosyl 5'-monophosphate synthetase